MSGTHSLLGQSVGGGIIWPGRQVQYSDCTLKGDCMDGLSLEFVLPHRWDALLVLPIPERAEPLGTTFSCFTIL